MWCSVHPPFIKNEFFITCQQIHPCQQRQQRQQLMASISHSALLPNIFCPWNGIFMNMKRSKRKWQHEMRINFVDFPRKKETLVYLLSHFENNLTSPFFQKKKNLINKKYSLFVALASLCLFSPCVGCVVLAGKSLLIFETERSNFCNKFHNE